MAAFFPCDLIAASSNASDNLNDFEFRIPSTISFSGSQSSGETKSVVLAARLALPGNFWVEASADHATESTEGLETKTLGLSATVGTNPIADYSIDLGADSFGVDNQYTVREGRIRLTAMPLVIFGFDNPGIEIAGEYRGAEFEFANSPNLVFTANPVRLDAQTFRLEMGFFMMAPWTIRVYAERVQLAAGFKDLNRPLAPLFMPETAISTAISWPGEDDGIGLSYGGKRWGGRVGASRKRAAVTEDVTFTSTIAFDYAWSKKVSTGVRYANSKSENDSTLEPIQTLGLDLVVSF